jgi:hypothetical protein
LGSGDLSFPCTDEEMAKNRLGQFGAPDLGMRHIAVEATNNFVLETFRLCWVVGVYHPLNQLPNLVSQNLASIETFSCEIPHFFTLIGRQALDFLNDFCCAHGPKHNFTFIFQQINYCSDASHLLLDFLPAAR